MLLLAGLELLEVEVELLALKNVTVGAAGLARTRGDHGEETTGTELLLEVVVDLGVLLALGKDALNVVRLLALVGGGLGLALLGDGLGVVGLVPLTEGGGVNLNDGRLDEGLGTEELVVGRVVALEWSVIVLPRQDEKEGQAEFSVARASPSTSRTVSDIACLLVPLVAPGLLLDFACALLVQPRPSFPSIPTHDVQETSLAGSSLGSPREVAGVKTDSTVLDVATTGADGVDALSGVELGHSSLTAELEFSLLAVVRTAGTRGAALVAGVPRDTHSACQLLFLIQRGVERYTGSSPRRGRDECK